MNVTGEKGLGNYLKVFLQICFYFGIVFLISLPFILSIFGFHINASAIVIYPNGIVLLIIMYKFIKLFDSLKNNNPFSEGNVKILKSASIFAIIEAILWIMDLMYEVILAQEIDVMFISILMFLAILFFGVSIALYILSELFKEAVNYKNENELTI